MEFNIPLEEVLSWPLTRTLEYSIFLKKWYKKKYGDPEDMEDMKMPGSLSGINSRMPSMGRKISKRKLGKSARRGASGHKYQFK